MPRCDVGRDSSARSCPVPTGRPGLKSQSRAPPRDLSPRYRPVPAGRPGLKSQVPLRRAALPPVPSPRRHCVWLGGRSTAPGTRSTDGTRRKPQPHRRDLKPTVISVCVICMQRPACEQRPLHRAQSCRSHLYMHSFFAHTSIADSLSAGRCHSYTVRKRDQTALAARTAYGSSYCTL